MPETGKNEKLNIFVILKVYPEYSVAFIEKLFNNFQNGNGVYGGRWYGSNVGLSNSWSEYKFYYEAYRCYKKSGSTLSFADYVSETKQKYDDICVQIEDCYEKLDEIFDPDNAGYNEVWEKKEELENEAERLKKENFFVDAVTGDTFNGSVGQARMYGMVFSANSFSDLSDAMKVGMIASSGYFEGKPERTRKTVIYNELSGKWEPSPQKELCFGMLYATVYTSYKYAWQGMRNLLNNKAAGVCAIFAEYEVLLFGQLGITAYYNRSGKINHAWSVVKVKNSIGKTLWIPFDYGIGPSASLSVADEIKEKYLRTEAMRYKLYLSGIKGAPQKKNFTQNDFR